MTQSPRRDESGRAAWQAGVDIGGTLVRAVTDAGGRRRIVSCPTPDSYPALLAVVADLLAQASEASTTRPAAVGCGLPGTSDGQHAVFVPALPWLEGQPIQADLAEIAQAPVTLGLDGQLTLLAEAAEGAARGYGSAVLVAVGTGIGGAMMVGGRIWRGHRGSAGAWGWLPYPGHQPDPRHGQFERAAAGRALDHRAAALAGPGADGDALAAGTAQPSGRDLVRRARDGDPAAAAEVGAFAADLGTGLAALASVLDPEIVLVGGGISAAMDLLGPQLEKAVAEAGSPDGRRVPVRAAALGPDGGVIGAWHAARGGKDVWL
jgi:glucokinase/fructokinase